MTRDTMGRRLRTPLPALMAGLLGTGPAIGQPASQPSDGNTLEPVTVTATRIEQRNFDAAAAIDTLGTDAIGAATRGVNLSEAVGRVPGLNVQDRQNFAQDLQVASRGFGARAAFGVRGVRLMQDGIPFTMPDGQGQTGLFDLDAAARIEVLRGPFAALYGNSSGGLITVFTDDPPRRPTWRAAANAGSHGSRKLGIGYGDTRGSLGVRANVSRFETDGYRDHSRARRDLAGLRLAWSPDADTSLALNATLLDQPRTEDPLGLTRQQLEQNPRQAGSGAATFGTRKSVDHRQLGVSWERRLNALDRLRLRGHLGERHVRQFLAFTGEAPSSSGGVVDLDRGFGGTSLQWSRSQRLAGGRLDLAIGIEYDGMHERRRGYVNEFGVAGALRRDEMNTVSSFDQYAIGEWWFAPAWKLSGGVRRSRVAFDVSDDFVTPINPDDSGSRRYTATNPVIGVLHALSDTVNLYASAGRGFETPTFAELAYRPDGQPGLNFSLEPGRSANYETGIKLMLGRSARVNLALFHTRTRNDIVPDANVAGRTTFRNAARTVRRGLELGLEAPFGEGFSGTLAWTWMGARFRDYPGIAGTDLSGKAIPGVPKYSLYGELGWRHASSGFATGVEARWNAGVAVDDANSQRAGSYAVFNWHAGFDWHAAGWQLGPFLRIDNVSGRRHVGSVIVNAAGGRYYEPAPGRSLVAGVRASYTL